MTEVPISGRGINDPHRDIVLRVEQWLKEVIIGFNICPFARRELEQKRIRYRVIEGAKKKQVITDLHNEFQFLDTHEGTETTLLIFADGFRNFYDYLDMLDLAQQALEVSGYEGYYQLASFHPDYLFEGEDVEDAAHYTNRSPYPIVHLLRESSVERAIANNPDIEKIPERNKALAREKGSAFWEALLSKEP